MAKNELTVNERELIDRLARITGHNKDVVRDVIKAQTEFVLDELKNGIPVRIGNLGEFRCVTRTYNGGYDFDEKKLNPRKEVTIAKFCLSKTVRRVVKESCN